jgi:predicted nucleic acid-binding protein
VSTFLDTNIVIYLVEQPPDFGPRTAARINAARAAGERLIVSDLVRMECRVHPLTTGDMTTLAAYDAFFASSDVDVVAITAAVCDRATEIRARHRLHTVDPLHMAAAIEAGCTLFLTNDSRLSGFPDLPTEVLS